MFLMKKWKNVKNYLQFLEHKKMMHIAFERQKSWYLIKSKISTNLIQVLSLYPQYQLFVSNPKKFSEKTNCKFKWLLLNHVEVQQNMHLWFCFKALKSALGSTSKHKSLLHQTKFAAVCFTHVFDFSIDSLISQ